MNPTTKSVAERGAWNALLAHYQKVRDFDLRKFFTDDPIRGEPITLEQM